jgi:hypothetical protein
MVDAATIIPLTDTGVSAATSFGQLCQASLSPVSEHI